MKLPRGGSSSTSLLGAAFLMATSAVGPGFLTQTVVFTEALGASFGFVILCSVLLDVGAQLNVWRVMVVSGRRAQELADAVLPGLGGAVSALVVLGGLAFNVGNVAGAGLGVNALLGTSAEVGGALASVGAAAVFVLREAKRAMDRLAQLMGGLLLLLTVWVAVTARPPLAEAAVRSVAPTQLDWLAVVTLVGGTVGGYITFAGGHRLLDAGVTGRGGLVQANQGAVLGIAVASVVRVLLFLAALGVVHQGVPLDPENPPLTVFGWATGAAGRYLYGLVMLAAAVTSVVGAAYTSVSFLKTFHARVARDEHRWIIGFILVSAAVFVTVGRPVRLLILAGAVNGFILPVTLGVVLLAAHRRALVGAYRHPRGLTLFGAAVALLMAVMSVLACVRLLSG